MWRVSSASTIETSAPVCGGLSMRRTTDACADAPTAPTVADQIASAKGRVAYNTWLTMRGTQSVDARIPAPAEDAFDDGGAANTQTQPAGGH